MTKNRVLILLLIPFLFLVVFAKIENSYSAGAGYESGYIYQEEEWEKELRNLLGALTLYTKLGDTISKGAVIDTIADRYYKIGVFKKAAEYYEQKYILFENKFTKPSAHAAEMAGSSYFLLEIDSSASGWFKKASEIFEHINDTNSYLRCSENLASVYIRQGLYAKAEDLYKRMIAIYNHTDNHKAIAALENQSGFLNFKKGDYNKAINQFKSAVEFTEKAGSDDYLLTDLYTNMAICCQALGMEKEMMYDLEKAIEYAKTSERISEKARVERILALIYYNKADYYHAEIYCLNCIKSAKSSNNYNILQLCYKDYSSVLEKGNDFIKALEYYEKHLSLRDSLNFTSMVKEKEVNDKVAYYETAEQRIRSELTEQEIKDLEMKNLKTEAARRENELELLKKQSELDNSEKDRLAKSLALEMEKMQLIENEQKVKELEQQRAMQQLQIKQKGDEAIMLQKTNEALEKDKILKETELENEKFARKMAVWLGVLMILVAVVILLSLISSRKKNEKLAESKREIEKINSDLKTKNIEVLKQNDKIIQQKDIIEQKNQSITDSIQYASRIQTAVLPPIDFLNEWKFENFILFKPKDIVSGDFYWGVKKNNKIIVAAGDCTGHGVPGAFMSMLGHAFLDEIVNTKEIENAASVLNQLRNEIINTLKQKGEAGEARDGMDISLVIIDPANFTLDFAGANNPLYLIRNNVLTKHEGDHMPIGIHFVTITPFTNKSIEFQKDDKIYLFSDGYADQFGGPKGKKFMYKQFQDILISYSDETMEIQKEILERKFNEWKKDRDQVDDVLVIGMRL